MAQKVPEESIETASDFMTFQIEPTEAFGELETVDVHSFFADQSKIKDFISCTNCKQEFDHNAHKPFLLPCLEAICKSCIPEISESQSYECSRCSHNHSCFQNGQIVLQIDNTREIASEIFRLKNGGSSLICGMCSNDQMASHRCFDCSVFICGDCVKLHQSLKTLKSHSFMEIKCLLTGKIKNLGLSYAPKHCTVAGHEKEQIKMHCSDSLCLKNVCVLCALSAHKDHNLCDITKVKNEMEAKIETYLKSINLKVQQANTSIAQLSDIDENCHKDSRQVQMEIKARFSEARKVLEKREKDLCEAVALYSKEKQMFIKSEKKKISSFIDSCKEARYYGKVSSDVNDHSYFVDIANIILPHLEILDSQVPEIEVTVDTMSFSSPLPESCFETAVDNLGKLSVSKVYSPKCTVVVSPPVSYVGQQIQFEIQLFSSTGKLIVVEDVSVSLKVNGKTYHLLKCAFETSSSSFTGIWVPDKPMKFTWIVVSNDIELQTLNGVIDVRKPEMFITADKRNEDKTSSLEEIHVVGRDESMVRAIQETFQQKESSKSFFEKSKNPCKAIDFPPDDAKYSAQSDLSYFNPYTVAHVSENFQDKIHLGKVSDVSTDAIDVYIPISEMDYKVFCFFGNKYQWLKKYGNHLQYDGQGLHCHIPKDEEENVRRKMETHLKEVKMIPSDVIEIVRNKDFNLSTIIQNMQQIYPNVCLIENEEYIEIISDNYGDMMKVKALLCHQMVGKRNKRVGRTFRKESPVGESNSGTDVYRKH